jgi:hypothetical protein
VQAFLAEKNGHKRDAIAALQMRFRVSLPPLLSRNAVRANGPQFATNQK